MRPSRIRDVADDGESRRRLTEHACSMRDRSAGNVPGGVDVHLLTVDDHACVTSARGVQISQVIPKTRSALTGLLRRDVKP